MGAAVLEWKESSARYRRSHLNSWYVVQGIIFFVSRACTQSTLLTALVPPRRERPLIRQPSGRQSSLFNRTPLKIQKYPSPFPLRRDKQSGLVIAATATTHSPTMAHHGTRHAYVCAPKVWRAITSWERGCPKKISFRFFVFRFSSGFTATLMALFYVFGYTFRSALPMVCAKCVVCGAWVGQHVEGQYVNNRFKPLQ